MRRRDVLLLMTVPVVAWPTVVRAKNDEGWRIGILDAVPHTARRPHYEAFRRRMGELGYREGRNIVYETVPPKAVLSACPNWLAS